MNFRYTAYTPQQKIVRGELEVADKNIAIESLERAGYNILSLKSYRKINLEDVLPSLFSVKKTDIVLFSRQLAMLLEKRITEPIKKLIRGVKHFAEGDLNYRIHIERYEEIALLAQEFNTMASSLLENQRKLRNAERLAAMSKFATLVSHEIRNPLNSMNINMQILKREIDNPKGDIQKKQK